jgi:hypothetical protein
MRCFEERFDDDNLKEVEVLAYGQGTEAGEVFSGGYVEC